MPKHDDKGVDLAIVLGGPKGGKGPPKAMHDDMMEDESDAEEVDPAFEAAAVEYDPSLAESPERLRAFKRAIKACVESY